MNIHLIDLCAFDLDGASLKKFELLNPGLIAPGPPTYGTQSF